MSAENEPHVYRCPICNTNFETTIKAGVVECPNCNEELELVNGEKAYIYDEFDDSDEDDEDFADEDGDDKDENE